MTPLWRAGLGLLFGLSLGACGQLPLAAQAPGAKAWSPAALAQPKPSPLASISARQGLRFEASAALRQFAQLNRDWEAAWTAKGRDRVEAKLVEVALTALEAAEAKSAGGGELTRVHELSGRALARAKELQGSLATTEALARKRELVHELQIVLTGALHEVVYGT